MANLTEPREKNSSRGLNLKSVLFLVGCFAAYALIQPLANRQFGWKLPGAWQIVERLQSPESNKTREAEKGAVQAGEMGDSLDAPATKQDDTVPKAGNSRRESPDSRNSGKNDLRGDETADQSVSDVDEFLTKLPKNRFQTPAGLVFGPGSDEGHRLKHVERHLKDIPNRPGSHGVFEGTMVDFLKAIDQAYLKAKNRDKGTSVMEDDGAMVFEASFTNSIGYLGGEAGRRQKNPKLKRMRLVVRNGNEVITAFPVR